MLNSENLLADSGLDPSTTAITSDRILYNYAMEQCQSAALDELFGNPGECFQVCNISISMKYLPTLKYLSISLTEPSIMFSKFFCRDTMELTFSCTRYNIKPKMRKTKMLLPFTKKPLRNDFIFLKSKGL